MARAALIAAAGLVGALTARAQTAPAPAAPAPAAPVETLKRVEVTGSRQSEVDERRQSTAAKIIIGRDEIEKFGDSTVGEILKRLPGVTMQGPPGRGGNVRMRGLGGGYTQLLIDGERVPPGFSFDALLPEQIERIEVLRAPTAETGARAIAGTINVITRGGYRRRINDLRLSAGVEDGHAQPGLSWTRNDALGELVYNFSLSANRSERATDTVTDTVQTLLPGGALQSRQRETVRVFEQRDSLHATGRLQWRGGEGLTAVLTPLFITSQGSNVRSGEFKQIDGTPVRSTVDPYTTSSGSGNGRFSLARLNGQATQRLGGDDALEWRAGAGQGRWRGSSVRDDILLSRDKRRFDDRSDARDTSFTSSLKLTRLLGAAPGSDGHKLVAGAEVEANRRNDRRVSKRNGVDEAPDFGETVQAKSTRVAAYVQDEWSPGPQWALNAGLRWEGIATQGSGGGDAPAATNRSSVWTPLLHAVWKPDPKARDQVRASLTRSYRAPTLQNLVARPSINRLQPPPEENTATRPDRAGNPALKPELATGFELAFERYLPGNGLVSANLFHRQISNYLRSVTTREPVVSWADVPRYVSRVQNVGDAVTSGIELEAKFRLSDVWPEWPKLDLRANASAFRSRVKTVPGPDNRLDQQPGGTANLGADYRFTALPLAIGGNLNWTPGYTTRISESQTAQQGRKLVADAHAVWTISPTVQVRVSASNLDPRDYLTGSTLEGDGVRENALVTQPSYVNWQLRLEMKL